MKLNIENAARANQKNILQWLAETLSGNLKEMRDRLMQGDETAIDDFFAVHTFDDGIQFTRPQQKYIEKSKFICDLAHELRTQDNACTQDPLFIVMEEQWFYGVEPRFYEECQRVVYTDEVEWAEGEDGYEEAAAVFHEQPGAGYKSIYRVQQNMPVAFFLTRKAAEEYIATQSHRHRGELFVWVDTACRNSEIKALRKAVMELSDSGGLRDEPH